MKKLLQVYKELDAHIEEELQNCDDIACHKGCDACCKSARLIPILSQEATVIIDHIKNQAKTTQGQTIIDQMKQYNGMTEQCPFLIDSQCGIYAVRPLACRTFYIHGDPCTEEEIYDGTRIEDIHIWDKDMMAPIHRPVIELIDGSKYPEKQDEAFHNGKIMDSAIPLGGITWSTFAKGIEKITSTDTSDPDSN